MKQEIINKLHKYVTHEILNQPDKQIESNAPILSTGIIDSFSLVDISLFVEETFGVEIDNTELNVNHFDSLEELSVLIEGRL